MLYAKDKDADKSTEVPGGISSTSLPGTPQIPPDSSHVNKIKSEKPIESLTKLAKDGNPNAQLQLGTAYFKGALGAPKDDIEAAYWFAQAAKQNLPLAKFNLAQCYEYGLGLEKDMESAVMLYTAAAEQGIEPAQRNAGLLYMQLGKFNDAAKYLKMAADRGNIIAMREYGRLLLEGKGVTRDPRQAIRYLDSATQTGDPRAHLLLADCFSGNILEIATDLEKMVENLWEAATKDIPEAQSKLGYCYEEGIGVNKNTEMAVKWYTKAAQQNYPEAMVNLGHCHTQGKGVGLDPVQAFSWYQKAAALSSPVGLYNLGVCFALGKGVAKDDSQAFSWFQQAAALGEVNAQYYLGVFYESGRGIPSNWELAYQWYMKAAGQNDPRALRSAGLCKLNGQGTPMDKDGGDELLQRATLLQDAAAGLAKQKLIIRD
jgi:TPR repeat protein